MKKRVYLETTIVSYLTSRPSRDLVTAAHQQVTREWWEDRRHAFELYVSQYVIKEAGEGDSVVAERRRHFLDDLPLLETTAATVDLAESLIRAHALPRRAAVDALHLAIASVCEMDILLTWNCRHLANAERALPIAEAIRAEGYRPPVICTPEELMGE